MTPTATAEQTLVIGRVARGRLNGVSDTLVLPFGHLAVTGEPATDVVRQVQAAVLERLN